MAIAIVHESCIKELFRMCQCCGKPITDTHVTYVGSQMRVSWKCLGGHSGTWTSSPEARRTPEVNSLSAASVLFTGSAVHGMSNSDGCVSSHSMSPQHHMHSSLSSAAPWRTDGCMAPIFTLEDKSTETEAGCLSLQIKEEQQEELLQGPEEAAGSTLTSLAVKSEDDDNVNRDTEPLNSTSTEHMETQAYITYCVPSSQPTNDDQNSRYHEQLRELFQDLKSSKQRKKGKAGGVQRCTECGKGFPCMGNLKQHMITHMGLKPVSCTVCGKGCCHLSELRRHLVRHAGENPITCTECGKPFANLNHLRKHMRFHTGEKPFHCYYCSQVFDDRSLLKEHMSSHRDKLFICPECGKVYICMSALKQHVRAHASHAASQTLTSAVDSKGFGLETEPLQIKEEQHEESPQRPEEAAGSLLVEKSEDDDNENRDTEPLASTSTEHMETQAYTTYCVPSSQPTNDDQLHSSICSESDISEDRDDSEEETREDQSASNKLNSHETENMEGRRMSLRNKLARDSTPQQTPPTSSQTENKCFSCTQCDKGFSSRSHLEEHMRVHTGDPDPPFVCSECGKVFLYLSNLRDHMVSHADENPIIRCTDCGKPFGNIPHLKSHIRVHTGVKPFICYHCEHVFDYRIHLKQHMSSHSHIDEKIFSCRDCSKVFVWLSALETHMKAHTEKRVCECGSIFGGMGSLNCHT